jgi:hypothetical protein
VGRRRRGGSEAGASCDACGAGDGGWKKREDKVREREGGGGEKKEGEKGKIIGKKKGK